MQILTLCIGLLALFLTVENMVCLFRFRSKATDLLSKLTLAVSELKKAREEEEQSNRDAGKAWEEGINNLMNYELQGYGLNLDFLQKEDELNG